MAMISVLLSKRIIHRLVIARVAVVTRIRHDGQTMAVVARVWKQKGVAGGACRVVKAGSVVSVAHETVGRAL